MKKVDNCPAVGSLVRLHHYMDAHTSLHLGSIDENYAEDMQIESGTLALVVGIMKRGSQDKKSEVPIVAIGDKIGWIFCDEWEPVES